MCFPFQQPLRYIALAVRCKQGSQLHRKENQSTSVNLSQAGDQIEKWIARRARRSDRRRDQAAASLSTCLEGDNGHRRSWAKRNSEDQIFPLVEKVGGAVLGWDPCAASVVLLQFSASDVSRCR